MTNFPMQVSVAEPGFQNFGSIRCFSGEIVTIKCYEDNSLVREWVSQKGNNRVLVVDGGGSMRRALLGDMLAEKAAINGWSGIVVYGCIRDVQIIAELDLGVQALAAHPMKTHKKGIGESNVPVRFHGVDFYPGHYIYADSNGILVSEIKL